MLKHNGGLIHPSLSLDDDVLSLSKLLPISPDDFIESVTKVDFDPDESSLPSTLQPIFKIGLSLYKDLYLSLAPQKPESLFLYSLSHDEFTPISGTISEFLNTLTRGEERADSFEPEELSTFPWNQVRLGNYDMIFEAVDEKGFDVNSTSNDDPQQRTLLMLALRGSRLTLAKGLVERKADWNVRDKQGSPTVFYSRKFLEGLKLAEQTGCDLNVHDKAGENLIQILEKREFDSMSFGSFCRLRSDYLRCLAWLKARV